ncbi:M23 family metallopeptidase [Gordonia sp. NPDC003424]
MDDLTGRGTAAEPLTTTGRDDWAESANEMTTIIPIDEIAGDAPAWDAERRHRQYRPTRSEITQDIVIPEAEFGSYRDVSFEDDDDAGQVDQKPFATLPATQGQSTRRGGKHRLPAPPNALKGGRAALIAMAAGAAVTAVAQVNSSDTVTTPANTANVDPAGATPDLGPGVAAASATKDMATFTDQLAVGKQLASAEAARENLLRRPLFVSPLPVGQYQFTSTFAMRWGSFHGGVDFAAPLGTPIHAATDGVVIEAGPASGYGNWVQIRADDGTVTMYGHMASSGVLVQKGQRVTAGDVIALVGSEGFSTGPHCHFEVWKNGTMKIDPAPWLAAHGVRMSAYVGG